ncbi:MAG TPA: LysM peptidoglycan-binding domain-containing protein [Chloroflexota bacterium]
MSFRYQPVGSTDVPPQAATIPQSTPGSLDEAPSEAASPGDAQPAQETPPTQPEPSPFAGIAAPPPEPPARSGLVTHTVAADEVLWEIAEQYHLRPETVLWANDLDDPDLLLVGQQLVIPPKDGVLYTIRTGDSLADVAARYGIELDSIVASNQIDDANLVQAGSDVFLPGARPIAASSQSTAVAEAPPDADQAAALAAPPIPLPDNIDALLAAGWVRTQRTADLYKTSDHGSSVLHEVPNGARLERIEGVRGGRILVRDPGDGRARQAMTGWINALDLDVGRAPSSRELPLAYPADTAMDIAHVFAPYRTQLDGSAYAEANCGPTAVAMALEAFGISVPSRQLRAEALDAQHMYGNGVGTLITALAAVVENHGLDAQDLYAGGGIHRWSLDEIRAHVQARHPVIVQVRYRSLPGRGGVYYFGDHYILVTGVVGDGFLYNDPIDIDGLGWDRVMSADRLRTAMDASDRRYAFSAFAVSR